ncbi:MAG: hypothetical protein KKF80_06845, partial [Candidatus Omnitrophica bacterium]|nr:hypothetical protein [Candidatus Omnitrophota bacterium]
MKRIILVSLFLLIFSVLSMHAIVRTSGTCDEIAHHIPVGVLMLKAGDFKVDTSQPPLSRYVVALPIVLFLNPHLPPDRGAWRVEDRASFGRDFFFRYNHRSRAMLFLGRFPIMLIGLACGILIVLWAHELCGPKAAFLS